MTDMLVNLYDHARAGRRLLMADQGIQVKRAVTADREKICGFIAANFGDSAPGWVSECAAAMTGLPTRCFIAVHGTTLIGFCCYDGIARGMLGPLGVRDDFRRKGVASELLYYTLEGMKAAGYAYAVIGWVNSEAFYHQACGAMPIPDSHPGVYSRLIEQSGSR